MPINMAVPAECLCFLVRGNSMIPVLRPCDRVDLHKVAAREIQPGDIVVFTAKNSRQIIHRVVRLDPLQTHGDNCENDDAPIPESSPLYRAVSFSRNGQKQFLTSGEAGMREFHRNQFRYRMRMKFHRILSALTGLNPFKILIHFRNLPEKESCDDERK